MCAAYAVFTTGFGGSALLAVACLMTGIARGGNNNFCGTMMSTLPRKKSAIGYNLLHGAFAMGAVISPLALILCTAGIVMLCIVQLVCYGKMRLPAENVTRSIKTVDRSFLKSRNFWLGATILFFYISTEYAIVNWLVTYFKDTGILSERVSQLMSSILWIVIFIGRMIGAALVGRVPRKRILLVDGVGTLCFFLLVFFSRSELPIFIGIMGIGLFMATIYTCAMSQGIDGIRGNDLAVSTITLIGAAGGIVTPAVVGLVAERAGIQTGMGVVVAVTVILLAAIILSVRYSTDTDI